MYVQYVHHMKARE